MPYINKVRRAHLDLSINELLGRLNDLNNSLICNAGDLNYTITRILDGIVPTNKRYSDINTLIGVLECAKLELYRRIAAPYEDRKIVSEGDVYLEVEQSSHLGNFHGWNAPIKG